MLLKRIGCLLLAGCTLLFAAAPDYIRLAGTVKDAEGTAIEGADVYLKSDDATKVQTLADGKFTITVGTSIIPHSFSVKKPVEIAGNSASLNFSVSAPIAKGVVTIFAGNGRRVKDIELNNIPAGMQTISLAGISNGFYIVQVTLDNATTRRKLIAAGSEMIISEIKSDKASHSNGMLAKMAAAPAVDTLVAEKEGYGTVETAITSYDDETIEIVLTAAGPIECADNYDYLPDPAALTYENDKLPSPWVFFDGTEMTRKDEWECRRKEILAMASKYIYGPCPSKPDEVTGTVSGGSVSISCKQGSNTANFSASIGSGSPDDFICLDMGSGILPSGKSLSLGSGNEGKIKSLYGISEINGNLAAAWMVDRVMDVLELNPDCGHDPQKLVVSGCSGCGKAAFLVGVFSRIPLTVIVESGGGGASNLRQTEWFRHGAGRDIYHCNWNGSVNLPQGIDNLEDSGICGPWVASNAQWLRSSPSKLKNLPFDQHLLLAAIAPRLLVHFTNQHGTDEWCHLGGTCEALSAWAAKPVFKALGVPENMGFLMYTEGSAPAHCGRPSSATSLANEFFKRLKGDTSAQTDVWTANDNDLQQPKDEWEAMWIDWDMDKTLQ